MNNIHENPRGHSRENRRNQLEIAFTDKMTFCKAVHFVYYSIKMVLHKYAQSGIMGFDAHPYERIA